MRLTTDGRKLLEVRMLQTIALSNRIRALCAKNADDYEICEYAEEFVKSLVQQVAAMVDAPHVGAAGAPRKRDFAAEYNERIERMHEAQVRADLTLPLTEKPS